MTDLAAGRPADLLALAAELVDIPSVSRGESPLADRIESALTACPWLRVARVGDNLVARTDLARGRRLVIAGHLDTVPANENARSRLESDVLWGLGSVDMKGGLAVMLDLAAATPEPPVDLTWCFYAREEIARAESGLVELWSRRPDLMVGDVAILCEPTDGIVEAGCQGTLRATVHLGGVRAHTARPFTGLNAIHRLAPVLVQLAGWEPRSVVLDGCEYTEQLQAVAVAGGVAGNVVPDAASVTLNHRYAPDRDGPAAEHFVGGLLDGLLEASLGDRVDVVDEADGAPPALDHPVLEALVKATGSPPRGKVGWTDVATFWGHGVPATNFGPGDPLLAHHPDEHVERSSLERARNVLAGLVDSLG